MSVFDLQHRIDWVTIAEHLGFTYYLCQPRSKLPLDDTWWATAKADVKTIIQQLNDAPDANLGVITGSDYGVAIIDTDPGVVFEPQLPSTLVVSTGCGGRHHYFRIPEGSSVIQKKTLAVGVQLYANRGVLTVGSIHPNGQRYTIIQGWPGLDLAQAPDWLLER